MHIHNHDLSHAQFFVCFSVASSCSLFVCFSRFSFILNTFFGMRFVRVRMNLFLFFITIPTTHNSHLKRFSPYCCCLISYSIRFQPCKIKSISFFIHSSITHMGSVYGLYLQRIIGNNFYCRFYWLRC